tara:strand:- start:6284 stop:6454 length:171 start_codon:yes stop_codon:yes gene_type:complete
MFIIKVGEQKQVRLVMYLTTDTYEVHLKERYGKMMNYHERNEHFYENRLMQEMQLI